MAAPPCVKYLLRNEQNNITVGEYKFGRARIPFRLTLIHSLACCTVSTAQVLVAGLPRTNTTALDVSSIPELDSQVASHDLVISLVPYIHHASFINLAIKHKANVITTSYRSDAVREQDARAKKPDSLFLTRLAWTQALIICMRSKR